MPTPKQLSTARHRKNTQRRSFPRQRKTYLSEEGLYQKTRSKKKVAPSPAFLLSRRRSCIHIDHIIALRRGLKGSHRRKKGMEPRERSRPKEVRRTRFDPHTAQSPREQSGTRSTANAPEAQRSIENAPGAQRSRENAPGAQNASPEQRTLWEHRTP